MPKDKPAGSLTDQQLLQAIRALIESQGEGVTTRPAGQADISVGDIVGEIVLHIVGPLADVVLEAADVTDVADVIGEVIVDVVWDVTKEVVVHIIVDIILDIIMDPLEAGALKTKGLTGVAEERLARAQVALQIASQKSTAPSSRELAVLRKVLLQSKARRAGKQ